ncbi:MAG: hypothetical protein R2751_09435 [Bacteroidales bacterium]
MLKVLHIEDRFHPDMGYQINYFARYHHPSCEFYILTSGSTRLWENGGRISGRGTGPLNSGMVYGSFA